MQEVRQAGSGLRGEPVQGWLVDLDAEFQFKDPWVTREFRVFDLLAQRSGLPPYVNDMLGLLGLDEATLIRSLRHVEPVSSFRSTFFP